MNIARSGGQPGSAGGNFHENPSRKFVASFRETLRGSVLVEWEVQQLILLLLLLLAFLLLLIFCSCSYSAPAHIYLLLLLNPLLPFFPPSRPLQHTLHCSTWCTKKSLTALHCRSLQLHCIEAYYSSPYCSVIHCTKL